MFSFPLSELVLKKKLCLTYLLIITKDRFVPADSPSGSLLTSSASIQQ